MKMKNASRRRALVLCLAALPLLLAPLACKRSKKVKVQTEEEAPRMASLIQMADARSAGQLVSGFYDVEQNAWRWAQKRFSVVLRPPLGAAQKGATLTLRFTVPEVIISKLQGVTLTATVNGSALAPETYSKAGDYTYSRDVASNLLTGDSARVDFALDKALAPSEADQRELAVVVLGVGLEPK
jgi:hypothetical protein